METEILRAYGMEYLEDIRAQMMLGGAMDVSDAEIERCIGGCVGSVGLIQAAKLVRSEADLLDYSNLEN